MKEKIIFESKIDGIKIISKWNGDECKLSLSNCTDKTFSTDEPEIYSTDISFSPDTECYGEGYNKLCQYAGTLSDLKMVGSYGDAEHYKFKTEDGYFQTYNMLLFSQSEDNCTLMGFTTCNSFTGIFRFNSNKLRIIVKLEEIEIGAGESIELESFYIGFGNKNRLLSDFGRIIGKNHKKLPVANIPTGWCSWLVYGPNISERDICNNLNAIRKFGLDLKYIQIDDGYQEYMGDWLSQTDKFKTPLKKLCQDITDSGFEPAIWVAPFIAERDSGLFSEHPDWFVKDMDGQPLSSDKCSFGGWRRGPWYMLDGSHPEAEPILQNFLKLCVRSGK